MLTLWPGQFSKKGSGITMFLRADATKCDVAEPRLSSSGVKELKPSDHNTGI